MTPIATQTALTQELVKWLEGALRYEWDVESDIARGNKSPLGRYLPVAKIAYERVLSILRKPELTATTTT
jgi:hypothetical protein